MKPISRLGKYELKIFTQKRCGTTLIGKYKKNELIEMLSEFDKLGKYKKGNQKHDKLYDISHKLENKDYKRISRFSKPEILDFMKKRYNLNNIGKMKKNDIIKMIREKEALK
jgi:hypothetical protein